VARGIQSKVLEAMAMARPVVTTPAAGRSIRGKPGVDFDEAVDPRDFARTVLGLMGTEAGETMGLAGRERVVAEYNWERNLAAFDDLLSPVTAVVAT
jgi:glycosyltransferase involved in cell wall biosynthesis